MDIDVAWGVKKDCQLRAVEEKPKKIETILGRENKPEIEIEFVDSSVSEDS